MPLLIPLLLAISLIIYYMFFEHKNKDRTVLENDKLGFDQYRISIDEPKNFNYGGKWFAVKTEDKDKLAKVLKLDDVDSVNWRYGTHHTGKGYTYITPQIGE